MIHLLKSLKIWMKNNKNHSIKHIKMLKILKMLKLRMDVV